MRERLGGGGGERGFLGKGGGKEHDGFELWIYWGGFFEVWGEEEGRRGGKE